VGLLVSIFVPHEYGTLHIEPHPIPLLIKEMGNFAEAQPAMPLQLEIIYFLFGFNI
jgi:hypothetical protein